MKITTNNIKRELLCYPELSPREQKDFDYVKEDCTPRFTVYKGQVHDVLDTQVITTDEAHTHPVGWAMHVKPKDPLAKWQRIATDSAWSGTVYRFYDDGVVVGSYAA